MGIKQSMRPKHQVLIMKCYPQYQKSANEVKPNPSELSYLLYYASTRRSKLQKVGAFLEKRTIGDVRKSKLGQVNIQVTLDILCALIEKCNRDLALFAPFVLSILSMVLQSHDVNFIEESVPTFDGLCAHIDQTTFVADPSLFKHFNQIIETYTAFASRAYATGKNRLSASSEALRYRTAGLQAIKSLVSSDSFATGTGHLRTVMPAILEQLVSDDTLYLKVLQHRENANDQLEKDRRRQSFAAAKSMDAQRLTNSTEVDSSPIVGTTAELDQRANEDLGVLALQSLRRIFGSDNKGQVRIATTVALEFGLSQSTKSRASSRRQSKELSGPFGWLTELFEVACRWTPVQDRFIILVTTMESLISSPILEDDLPRQYELALIVTHLLKSDINFIGLSVMDVLIGLIQHVLLLLQLGGQGSNIAPHPQQALPNVSHHQSGNPPAESPNEVVMEVVKMPSHARFGLLTKLQLCISDLAVHIYYTDQIGDMVSALLSRLKPSATNSSSTASAVENPQEMRDAIADSANSPEKPHSDAFFSFDTARVIALESVKAIIVTANSQSQDTGTADIRSRVDIAVWEGTQWLLRDPDAQVRRAYVDALLTWLDLEVSQKELRLAEDSIQLDVKSHRRLLAQANDTPKRGISSASTRKRARARAHSSFMQLLHLSIYEHALSFASSEPDVLLLHLLLATLVRKLGVNSITSGLPMIFRLQDDIDTLEDAAAIIHVASLTQGYFWAISDTFEFENSNLGRQVRAEVSRRASLGLWTKSISMPPAGLEAIGQRGGSATAPAVGSSPRKSLNFLTSREELVELIADGYSQSIMSPPSSPPVSPGRPVRLQSARSVQTMPELRRTLPAKVRAQMLEVWSREACIEAAEIERGRTSSLSGSKTGSGSGRQNLLNADGQPTNGAHRDSLTNLRASPARGRFASPPGMHTPLSDSSARSVVRVEELKKALSGTYIQARPFSYRGAPLDDQASESMITGDFSASETSLPPRSSAGSNLNGTTNDGTDERHALPYVREGEPLHYDTLPANDDDDIPPVPMLPANLRSRLSNSRFVNNNGYNGLDGVHTVHEELGETHDGEQARAPSGAAHTIDGTGSVGEVIPGKVDLRALLKALDEQPARRSTASAMDAPPY